MIDKEKIIYDILCSDEQPPEGQHWEGFVASKIAAVFKQREYQSIEEEARKVWGNPWLEVALWADNIAREKNT